MKTFSLSRDSQSPWSHNPGYWIPNPGYWIPKLLNPYILLLVILLHVPESYCFFSDDTVSCSNFRRIFREKFGTISDGKANYTQDTECEWLIESLPDLPYINLEFESIATECSYDYVFVFDGSNSSSRLIGSFSGQTLPPPVYTSSGFMYIKLFSDTNYALEGFTAHYSLSDCPFNCSGNGFCKEGVCECFRLNGGDDCSLQLCPDNCGESADRGKCEVHDGKARCSCNQGFVGDDCSLDDQNYVGNTWSVVSRSGPGRLPPRTRHASVYHEELDLLYVYGGFDLNSALDDFLVYSFKENSWMEVENNNRTNRWDGTYVLDPVMSAPTFSTSHLLSSTPTLHSSSTHKSVSTRESSAKRGSASNGTLTDNSVFDENDFVPHRGDIALQSSDRREDLSEDSDNSGRVLDVTTVQADNEGKTLTKSKRSPMMKDRGTSIAESSKNFRTSSEFLKSQNSRNKSRSGSPGALEGHAMVRIPGGLLLFGGKTKNGSLSNKLWRFDLREKYWSLVGDGSSLTPSAVWLHSMTVAEQFVYILGGSTVGGKVVSNLFRISINNLKEWEEVKVLGGKLQTLRLTGHITVYHAASNSLFVHGGLVPDVPRFSKLSNQLFSLHLGSKVWSNIQYPRSNWSPPELAFHSATLVGNYLVIFGGYTHKHNSYEECYSSGVYLYSLECHTWISQKAMEHNPPGSDYPFSYGMFGSSMFTRNQSQIILLGGFHGVVSGDVVSLTLPSTLSSLDTPCHLYGLYNACAANPKCGWCGSSGKCMRNLETFSCTGNLLATGCPGVCSTLGTCHSCTSQGSGECRWCVRSGKCYNKNGLYQCKRTYADRNGPWWLNEEQELNTPEQCTKSDIRPGLTLSRYDFPADLSRPDHVETLNSSQVFFNSPKLRGERELKLAGKSQVTYLMRGTILPVRNPNVKLEQLKICIGQASASLYMFSNPPDLQYQKIIDIKHPAEVSSGFTPTCQPVFWADTHPIFLYLNFAYSLKLFGWRNISTSHTSSMRLEEGGSVYKLEALQPFMQESCKSRTNCLSCMEDADCAWCLDQDACQFRTNSSCPTLPNLEPAGCVMCTDHVYCKDCTEDQNCAWVKEENRCVRKDRFTDVLSDPELCSVPCQERIGCTSCLLEQDCVWCQDTQECFAFSVYTSQYQYGGCKSWVDSVAEYSPQKCLGCGQFETCSTCLESVGCGWCYNSDNPMEGTCTPGSFTNFDHGTCNIINTSQIENSTSSSIGKNRSMTDPSSLDTSFAWAYEECPDIDECKLNIHKCHSKATCKNVPGSYLCSCNKGFAGDGFNECRRSCLETCERGFCSGEPHFQCKCNLGWTGPACDIDCGCSFHSTCSQGVGFCDQCLNYTSGATCQFCESGTYGDAVSSSGCTPCHCNGHEDRNKGICDPKTGICFCKAKFHGDRCEKCAEGYFGEPVNGGDCHHDCFAKSVIIGEQQGIIGVVNSTGGLRDCLWIVSSNPGFSLDPHTLKQGLDGDPIPVSLSLFKSRIDVNCEDNNVYIYDGLPPAVSTINNSRLLAVLCSDNTAEEVVMVAESGLISVVYSEKPGSRGFNASFRIESCGCHGEPDCDCEKKVKKDSVCHNNCTQNQGICDSRTGRCRCNLGFMEDDCSQRSGLNQLLSSKIELEDSNGILSRIGHSLISDSNGVLWLFGGYHPDRGILQDLRAFDTKTEMFKIVNFQTLEKTSELSSPPPRLFHAACYALESNSLYIHGGMNFNEELSDFWRFDLNDLVWESLTHTIEKRSIDNEKVEISLAGHTLTYIPDSRSILIIGGYSQDTGLNGVVYEYLLQYSTWKRIKTTGFPPTSLFGHTASYIQGMKTLFVFGLVGSSASSDSGQSCLYCLNIDTKVWSVLPFSPKHSKAVYSSGNTISGRMFHSGVETPNSLIFLGADPPNSKLNTILVFWLECLQWVKITAEKQDFKFMRKQTEWIGPDFDSNFGARSVFSQGSIYTIGGVRGIYRTYISRIQLSQDVCNLFSLNQIDCLDITGCNFCNQGNSSVCFSEYRASQVSQETGDLYAREPGDLHAREPGDLKICSQDDIVKGQVCDQNWISQNDRDCKSLSSCGECLVEWPVFGGSPIQSHCQWCHGCDRGGKCVPRGLDCSTENLCYSQQKSIELSGECPELECSATSCTNCLDSNCFWSKQFTRSGKQRVSVGEDGVGWTCQRKSLLHILEKANKTQMVIGETSPPLSCPSPCHALQDCQACLEGGGADAGDEGCVWSVNLGRCLSAVLKPMLCLGGICGKVLKSGDSCPPNCKEMRTCSSCLKQTPCGWCSFTQETVQGIGVCAQGTLENPETGSCLEVMRKQQDLDLEVNDPAQLAWNFARCPLENECINDHHSCLSGSENCIDTIQGYRCECSPGFVRGVEGACKPVCERPCVHGTCVRPGECACGFGFTGPECDLVCLCNGNSNCQGPQFLDICIQCQNHTTGNHCESCLPGYVGDPTKGEACVSCLQYCSGNSNYCFDKSFLEEALTYHPSLQIEKNEVLEYSRSQLDTLKRLSEVGSKGNTLCVNCQNNTKGEQCHQCMEGYFRVSDYGVPGCVPCFCNNHGNQCDPITGGECNCLNHTVSEPNICSSKAGGNGDTCWRKQCSRCKEFYIGDPVDGHQCFRSMSVDHDYCFMDEEVADSCSGSVKPLRPGDTVLYAVQPKFRNVDIKIIIDVTEGSLDVYLSAEAQMFLVKYNQTTGYNSVNFDKKYPIKIHKETDEPEYKLEYRSRVWSPTENYFSRYSGYIPIQDFIKPRRNHPILASNITVSTQKTYHLRESEGSELKTFETLREGSEVLLVKNLKHRLVITLHEHSHDLRASKFYILLQASTSQKSELTLGNIFFRQDQLHIDLFVFFSVFFSCFFLFLAVCVVFWKFKQLTDIRRIRQRQVLELTLMARRPFAVQNLVLECEPLCFRSIEKPLPPLRDKRHKKWSYHVYPELDQIRSPRENQKDDVVPQRGERGPDDANAAHVQNDEEIVSRNLLEVAQDRAGPPNERGCQQQDGFRIRGVTVEPLADGQAAVASILIHLPGDHVRLGVGCVLTNKMFAGKPLRSYRVLGT